MVYAVRWLALFGVAAASLALGACQPNHPNTRVLGGLHVLS